MLSEKGSKGENVLLTGAWTMIVIVFAVVVYVILKHDGNIRKNNQPGHRDTQAATANQFAPKFWVDEFPPVGKMWAVTQPTYASETTMQYVVAKDENGNKFLVWLSNTAWNNPTRIGPPISPGQELRVRRIRYTESLAFINIGILIAE